MKMNRPDEDKKRTERTAEKEKQPGVCRHGKHSGRKKQSEKYEEKMPLSVLRERLPEWYAAAHRKLPWRETGNPYDVWLSEIMCQQTRISAVIDYFHRFKKALPDVQSLSAVDDEELMKLWEGLGYYSRARNLKKAAIVIMEQYDGQIPASYEELLKLPGIGSYTAGAIASIAFGEPVPAVDGNVLRVCSRVSGNDLDIAAPETKKSLEARLLTELLQSESGKPASAEQKKGDGEFSQLEEETHINTEDHQAKAAGEITPEISGHINPGIYNQALMELGALVCLPNGAPLCSECPVHDACYACLNSAIGELPVKHAAKKRRIEHHTVLLIRYGDQVLLQKREEKGLLAGLWGFPLLDGDINEEEALETVRNWGLDPVYIKPLPPAKHIFTHIEWRMKAYQIRIADFTEQTAEHIPSGNFAKKENPAQIKTIPARFDTDTVVEPSVGRTEAVMRFADRREISERYSIPSAFAAYNRYIKENLR